jgi:hypothetical protein
MMACSHNIPYYTRYYSKFNRKVQPLLAKSLSKIYCILFPENVLYYPCWRRDGQTRAQNGPLRPIQKRKILQAFFFKMAIQGRF